MTANPSSRPLAALLAVACLGLLAPASPAAAAGGLGSLAPGASARQAARFWTPQRMRAAAPLEVPAPRGGGLARASALTEGGDPGAAAVSDFVAVPDPTAPGLRVNGAVFIVLPHHEGFGRCSGTSVEAPNRSVVVTAGHCVNEGGPGHWFDKDWVFVPGYHDGLRPFGVFVARWVGATAPWIEGSENGDVGAAVVGRNERGQTLGDAVGADRIAFGLPPGQVFDVHGYPVGPPFDGASQRICAATPFLGHDLASFLAPGPLNLAARCEVTGGASGGGWTIQGDVLNSVTDYGYGDDRATDFGSYFGGAVRALYERAAALR